jgi:Carbamoylphosphate synthase large subunit (split gene in MJ)
MKILLTAIGKRIQLINYLKKSCEVLGTDCGELVSASCFVDKFFKVPKYNENGYIESLISICNDEKIDMLIPLYEKEYKLLSENREKFIEVGTKLLLSSSETIEYCNNKSKTFEFFKSNNINTPETFFKDHIKNHGSEIIFPLIIKPIDGMGSSQVYKVNNKKELEFFIEYVEKPIIQEYVDGIEYTIDTLCDFEGKVISIVPRERIEVRSGEVSKSRTVKDVDIIEKANELLQKLKIIGPGTIQCIKSKFGDIKFIEINPRFGGGVPLSFEAGVDYGKYFNLMCKEENITPIIGEFEEITMLRYDSAVYLKHDKE